MGSPVGARSAKEDPDTITVQTSASYEREAFKIAIHESVTFVAPLPAGPVSLQVAFVVGPRRNWCNLWKPTIDALGHLLGHAAAERRWHPRDGRIVELGLHCSEDPVLGHDVVIALRAAPDHDTKSPETPSAAPATSDPA